MSNTDKIADILKDFKALNELEQIKELYFYAKTINSLYTTEISEEEKERLFKNHSHEKQENEFWDVMHYHDFKAAISELKPRNHQAKSKEDIPYLEHMNRLIDGLLANEHDHSNTEELSVMIKDWSDELKAAFGKGGEG